MRTAAIVRHCIFCALLLLSASSGAEIVVIPGVPSSTQNTHIQVVNQYATVSAASIVSATITRSGNQFSIAMLVDLVCPGTPTAPIVTADFDVGVLNAGTYQVAAAISHRSHFPDCGAPLLNQSASFTLGDPIPVPVGSSVGYLIAACFLAFFAAGKLRNSDGRDAKP